MSNNLYLEAIEAAEELKNSAEEKVKQHIIESMSPQIKMLVEKKLMEEEDGALHDDESSDETEDTSDSEDDKQEECGTAYESVNEVTLDEDSRRILNKFISEKAKKEALSEKIESLKEAIKTIKKATILAENTNVTKHNKSKINLLFKNIIREIKNIKSNSIIKSDKTLLKEYYNLIKELNNMSTRRNRKQRFLDESLEDLLEMNLFEDDDADDDSEADEDDMPMDAESGDDEELDLDMPMDDDDDMPSLDDMGGSVSADTTVEDLAKMAGLMGDSEPSDEGDDDEDLELEGFYESDMGEDMEEDVDEMSEADLEEMYEMDEITDEDLDEADIEEMYESRSNRRNKVLEIDENMLRREIGRMKAIREGEAKDMASHFGGGSLEGEAFVDGVELNKLHEMRNKAAKVVRKNRMLESKLAQYKKALRGMKGQLQEMNLFNAKLLYANKLMQNRDLSIKQQRHVVESLDEAKTLGEAKILFESLSKSLVSRPASKSRNLNESASRRTLNASSAPVRSAQTRRENVALDRWATLAGIKK